MKTISVNGSFECKDSNLIWLGMTLSIQEELNTLFDVLTDYKDLSGIIPCEWVRCNIACDNDSVPLDVKNFIIARMEPNYGCNVPQLNETTPPADICAPCTYAGM